MASNALIPLVSFEKADETVNQILQNISSRSSSEDNAVIINQNAVHGSLLQLAKLMSKWSSLSFVKIDVNSLLLQILSKGLWVTKHAGINPISRKVLLDILVMFLRSQRVEGKQYFIITFLLKKWIILCFKGIQGW